MATTLSPRRGPSPAIEPPPRQRTIQARVSNWAIAGTLAIALAASVWIAVRQTVASASVAATADASEFSAERAGRHLGIIAAAPRFVGSAGHAATRAYLADEIKRLGLTPELQRTTSALRFPGAVSYDAGSVENVLVRIPGTSSTGAILLNAHYDGGATGPAAGDCGACVVTLLETMRALRAGPPLTNDVIFVFSDAEEVGDLGAHAFATQHPWMSDVRLALNFEAQGAAGPALLYVTSARNAALVESFARAAPRALTSSFFAGLLAAFPAMRGACDLQDYMDAGSAGMGFIIAGNAAAYHTALDKAGTLDARSVQHFGNYALGLVRHFGARDLTEIAAATDAVFFNAWPGRLVHYPVTWALPLAASALFLLLLVVVIGIGKRTIGVRRVLEAALTFLGSVIAGVLVPFLIWWGVHAVDPDLQVFMVGRFATAWYLTGLSLLAMAAALALPLALRNRLTVQHQLTGATLAVAVGGVLLAIAFPAGSYILVWPLAAALPALACALLGKGRRLLQAPWTRVTLAIGALVPAVMILVPLGLNGVLGLITRLEGTAGAPVLALSTIFIAVLTALGYPLVRWALGDALHAVAHRPPWWSVPVGAGLVSVALIGVGTTRHSFDANHPRPDQIRYELDADRGTAQWATSDARLDEWTSQFIPASTPRVEGVGRSYPGGPATFATAATVLPLPAPELHVLEDISLADVRLLRLRIISRRAAPMLRVRLEATQPLVRVSVGGQLLDFEGYEPAARGMVTFAYAAPPADGIEVVVRAPPATALRVAITDLSSGIPEVPGWRMPRRPATTMPAPGATADGIIIRRTFELPVRHAVAP